MFGLASWTMQGLCNIVIPYPTYQRSLWGKMEATISIPPPKNQRQRSINDFGSRILHTLRAMESRYPIFNLPTAFMGKNASDDIASASVMARLYVTWPGPGNTRFI